MRTVVDPRVYLEIQQAMDYYRRNAGIKIAAKLFLEFKRCRELIGQRPKAFPIVRDSIRRLNLYGFPYHILYKVLDDVILIVTFKHDHRDPDLGLER